MFDLSKMQPYSLSDLLDPLREITEDIALYLPRTSDLLQLGNSAGKGKQVEVIHYCMEGASKVSRISFLMVLLALTSVDRPSAHTLEEFDHPASQETQTPTFVEQRC